jgi:hypothetical protein
MIMEKLGDKKSLKTIWGNSEEDLLAKWADKATCYRWMHEKAQKKFYGANLYMTLPVIVLSTLTGTANFGMGSIFPENLQGIAQLGIGGVSLVTGIISTIANFMEYAQKMEAHRGSSISWGKLHRKIAVELSLPRTQREPCMEFLIVCRAELDRLIEQSPAVPDDIISSFTKEFPDSELAKPVKWNDMEKTRVYIPKDERVGTVLARAATVMKGNNRLLKEVATTQVKKEIVEEVMRRQNTPPDTTLRETIRSDLDALKSSGIVSQFFNRSAKIISPLRSQRSSEPEKDDEFVSAKGVEDIVLDIPENLSTTSEPLDTYPESEHSHEPASSASDEAAETPSQLPQTKETHSA